MFSSAFCATYEEREKDNRSFQSIFLNIAITSNLKSDKKN